MRTSLKSLLMLFFGILCIGSGFSIGYCTQPIFNTQQSFDQVVEPGQTLQQIVNRWQEQGRLKQGTPLVMMAKFLGDDRKIKAGIYRFLPTETAHDILLKLTKGDVIQGQLRILEGWTVRQMLDAILNSKYLMSEDLRHKLIELSNSPEGWFYPDTYQYRAGDSAGSVLLRAHDRMKLLLRFLWQGRDTEVPYENAYEALIAASIIERETAVASERPIIAGIIAKRLKSGMRLQMDPTVLYGLTGEFSTHLTHEDLQIANPYNTYRQAGLPPTPICLPSRSSIEAALHPVMTDFWYFVAKGDGTHRFSKTLAEQNEAIRLYRATQNGKA